YILEGRRLIDDVMGLKMRARAQRAHAGQTNYSCSRADGASSGTPLGANCSGIGTGWRRALRTGLRALGFLVAARFAVFLTFLTAFRDFGAPWDFFFAGLLAVR